MLENNYSLQVKKWYNKLIFKKYRIKNLLKFNNLSYVFDGIYEQKGIPIVLKIDKKDSIIKSLESEAYFLLLLKGFGIPKVLGFGYFNSYPILIQEKLGVSIEYISKKKKLTMKDICMFAIQAIERIQYVHSKGIVHRDIKPSNFVIGRENPEIIYLIDFGISRKYISSRTGKHLNLKKKRCMEGSLRYDSISSIKGYEKSRRDDLESLGYTIIYLVKYSLPWDKILISNLKHEAKIKIVSKMKELIKAKDLCSGLPEEIGNYIDYCKKLNFSGTPDYEKMKFFFFSILIKNRIQYDLKFSYLDKAYLKQMERRKKSKSLSRKKKPQFNIINNIRKVKTKETNINLTKDIINHETFIFNTSNLINRNNNISFKTDRNYYIPTKINEYDHKEEVPRFNYISEENSKNKIKKSILDNSLNNESKKKLIYIRDKITQTNNEIKSLLSNNMIKTVKNYHKSRFSNIIRTNINVVRDKNKNIKNIKRDINIKNIPKKIVTNLFTQRLNTDFTPKKSNELNIIKFEPNRNFIQYSSMGKVGSDLDLNKLKYKFKRYIPQYTNGLSASSMYV